jgi:hypothetical protein
MKKRLLLLFCIVTSTLLLAQKPSKEDFFIAGKIIDAKTNQALEYATVVLKNTKTQRISGGITNENGAFNILTPKGTYDISVEYISFKSSLLAIIGELFEKSGPLIIYRISSNSAFGFSSI